MRYYIASCKFTTKYPEASRRIQEYIKSKGGISTVRCCVPKYKIKEFEDKLSGSYRDDWCSLADCGDYRAGDTVYSICHNCSAIIEETKPEVVLESVWELILSDRDFKYPDYEGREMIVQDCWRAYDRKTEQEAVRALLKKMNVCPVETDDNYDRTDFCGYSLYEPCIERNRILAPHRYKENAEGKFIPRPDEEKKALMTEYCKKFNGKEVVSYCHYCEDGLELGGARAAHLASLIFEPEKHGAKM